MTLREQVRRRAHERCEYCHVPQAHDPLPFQVDHVIAQQHLGPTDFDNLAWSCFACNHRKGPNVSSVLWDLGHPDIVPLFNPRRQVWSEHFEWQGPYLVGLTPEGRATIECLGINQPHRVALRRAILAEGVRI